jgi:hypothetical protein
MNCPCGEIHELSAMTIAMTRVAYESVTAELPPDVVINIPAGRWRVPRIFIAVHGLKPADLPALAAQYGFPPA